MIEPADIVRHDSACSSRREFLSQTGLGLGGVALAWLLKQDGVLGADSVARGDLSPYAARTTHFAPKANRVIQIFCAGGVSHVETFDYKPELDANDGKAMSDKGKVDTFFGQPGNLMKSRFAFRQRGQCGH